MDKNLHHDSLLYKIQAYLLTGKKLTVLDALKLFSTYELRHYLAIIRKTMKVSDKWIQKDGKRWKEYWININNNTL